MICMKCMAFCNLRAFTSPQVGGQMKCKSKTCVDLRVHLDIGLYMTKQINIKKQ